MQSSNSSGEINQLLICLQRNLRSKRNYGLKIALRVKFVAKLSSNLPGSYLFNNKIVNRIDGIKELKGSLFLEPHHGSQPW